MKNKSIGLAIVCALACGLSSYGSHEEKAKRSASDEKNLKISHEIVRLYANLMVIKEWDQLSDEIWLAGHRAGSSQAMCASWGAACAVTMPAMRDTPAAKRPKALFNAVRQKQDVIEAAIIKEKFDILSPEALEQAMIEFIDLSHKRLANENLNRVVPGLREYYVKAIASVVALYLEIAPASDGKCIGERFEELFMGIVSSELGGIEEIKKGAHQPVNKAGAIELPL